jgi:hypothetical protein
MKLKDLREGDLFHYVGAPHALYNFHGHADEWHVGEVVLLPPRPLRAASVAVPVARCSHEDARKSARIVRDNMPFTHAAELARYVLALNLEDE